MQKKIRVSTLFLVILLAIIALYHPNTVKAAEVIDGFHGGSGTKDDPYQIATVEEFEILRGNLSVDDGYDHTDFYDTYFVLTKDIAYDSSKQISAPQLGLTKCKIDGKGHTVSGITSNGKSLFNRVNETEITNIKFKNCNLKNTPLLAKDIFDGKLSNITFSNSKVSFNNQNKKDFSDESNYGSKLHYGGLVNWVYGTKTEKVNVNINMTIKGTGVYGMLYGNFRGNATGIKTAGTLKAAILYVKKNQAVSCIGGMFGNIEGTVKNSVNNAKITVSLPNKIVGCNIAGISGSGSYPLEGKKTGCRYYKCKNQGAIKVTTKWKNKERLLVNIAGITAGFTDGDIQSCSNSGNITAPFSEGIAGITNTANGTITKCSNSGKITGVDTKRVAGIVNWAYKNVKSCTNSGAIKNSASIIHYDGDSNAAGIVNYVDSEYRNVTIRDCKNKAKVTAANKRYHASSAAGIVNHIGQTKKYHSTVYKCSNSGTISGDGISSGIVDSSGNWQVKKGKNVIKSCTNTGKIYTRGNDEKPGICGYAVNTTIKGCKNRGKIIEK